MASTASLSPLTTCKIPFGNPASSNKAASIMGTEGSLSDGFSINAFPYAIAGANIHIGIIAGKLKGVIPAVTPSACLMEYISIPGPALSVYSPFSSCGAPMQYSTTSRPLTTSPAVSGRVLPCSRLKHSANLSISLFNKSTNFIKTLALRCGFVAAQAG